MILANPGVASYEVALALASVQRNERLLVQTTSRQRRFSTHPWLGHVREFRKYVLLADTFVCENVSSEASGADGINPAQMAPSLRMDGIVQDRGLSGEPSIHLIGTHLAFLSGVSGSAQYSSFTAKRAALVIWMMSLMPQKLERVASVFRDYPFKSRGAMLSSGPNCAGIWLGSHSPIGRPPALTGPVAATIRRLFYCAQIRLFYSTKPMPRIILKSYALLVLVGSVPWLAKAYFSSESTTKLRSRG